jgi:hypothetical protein
VMLQPLAQPHCSRRGVARRLAIRRRRAHA